MVSYKAVFVILVANLFLCYQLLAQESPYKVGIVIPLSGPAASLGENVRKGVELGLASLPPETRNKIKVFFEDGQFDGAKSISAFNKLKSQQDINSVIIISSGIGHAVAPLAERAKILTIVLGASDKSVAAGKQYVFTHWVSPEAEASLLVGEIKKREYAKLAIVTSEQQGAVVLKEVLLTKLKESGDEGLVVHSEQVAPNERDFRTILSKIRAKEIDGIVSILIPGSLSAFARQARDLKVNAELFGFEMFEDAQEVKASDGALIGKWYVNGDDGTDEFRDRFVKQYNEQPSIGTSNAFDAIQLIGQAVLLFNGYNPRIAEHLRTLENYHGATGLYSADGTNGFNVPAAIKIVTESGFRKLY